MDESKLTSSDINVEEKEDNGDIPQDSPAWGKADKQQTSHSKFEGLTGRLVFCIMAAVLGSSFQFGYHTGVINAPKEVIEDFIRDTYKARSGQAMDEDLVTFIWSTVVGIFAIGGMIGAMCVGLITNRFGRRTAMLLNNVLAALGAALMMLSRYAKSYEMLAIGRLIIGVNCGINTGVAPMYITEMSPTAMRGAIGITNQVGITSAILISQIVGLPDIFGNPANWPYLFGLSLVPCAYQIVALAFCPETPKFLLINRNRSAEAEKVLVSLRGTSDVRDEMLEMKREYDRELSEPKVSLKELFKVPSLKERMIICIVLQLSQQLSGINAVLYYSTDIFKSAGLADDQAPYATLGTGAVIVLMTFVSIPLIESAGRRTLHLVGLSGMCVNTILLASSLLIKDELKQDWAKYIAIVVVVLFVVFFALGPGSIPWFYPSELFRQNARGSAVSIAIMVNWLANFIVGQTFLPIKGVLNEYTFFIFTVLLVLFILFTYKKVPETKNRTIEEITAEFENKHKRGDTILSTSSTTAGGGQYGGVADKEGGTADNQL